MFIDGNCCVCNYWELTKRRGEEGYQDEGICRRRAPVGIASPDISSEGKDSVGEYGMFVAWPKTFELDFCGDYESKADVRGKEKPPAILEEGRGE